MGKGGKRRRARSLTVSAGVYNLTESFHISIERYIRNKCTYIHFVSEIR
jgi:hypothetical protein